MFLCIAILLPVVGEFFIRLAEERGFYANPSSKIWLAMDWLTDSSYFWVTLFLISGFTAGVWSDYFFRNTGTNKPDYNAWDQINEFYLWQAACLWAELAPGQRNPPNTETYYVRFTMLKDAARNQELGVNLDFNQAIKLGQRDTTVINKHTLVSRAELKTFAEKRKLKPPFLFPEERK